jgi:hypothetical protein
MPVPRMLLSILLLSVVGSCSRHVSPTPAPASSRVLTDSVLHDRLIHDTTLFYAAYCRTPKDSLMTALDSASRAACRLRGQRQMQFKIF